MTVDVYVLGRVGADLYPQQLNTPLEDVRTFERFVGGFAGNLSTGLARLGIRVAIISAVGDDGHGRFVRRFLVEEDTVPVRDLLRGDCSFNLREGLSVQSLETEGPIDHRSMASAPGIHEDFSVADPRSYLEGRSGRKVRGLILQILQQLDSCPDGARHRGKRHEVAVPSVFGKGESVSLSLRESPVPQGCSRFHGQTIAIVCGQMGGTHEIHYQNRLNHRVGGAPPPSPPRPREPVADKDSRRRSHADQDKERPFPIKGGGNSGKRHRNRH